MTQDGRPRCKKCGRPLTDPVSVALGIGPICRGDTNFRRTSIPTRPSAHRGRAFSDPLYVNTTLFVVGAEPGDNEKKRRRTMLFAHLPFRCGDITFYPVSGGGWQSSGGSRVLTDDELLKTLEDARMI